jgi:hypothetical protein
MTEWTLVPRDHVIVVYSCACLDTHDHEIFLGVLSSHLSIIMPSQYFYCHGKLETNNDSAALYGTWRYICLMILSFDNC